jgi:CspA family cold shock protein
MLPEPPPTDTPKRVTGIVKWYSAEKGFGFVQSGDIDADILLHRAVLIEAGHCDVGPGASVVCDVVRKIKGYQCTRVLSVTGGIPQPRPSQPKPRAKRNFDRPSGWRVRAWLKSYSPQTGRGTLTVFDADGDLDFIQLVAIGAVKKGEEAFVPREVFEESGADISVGQVYVCEIVREPGGAKCTRVLGLERRM